MASIPERLLKKMRRGTVYNIKALADDLKIGYRQCWTALQRLERRGLVKRSTKRNDGFREKI